MPYTLGETSTTTTVPVTVTPQTEVVITTRPTGTSYSQLSPTEKQVWAVLGVTSMAVGAFHGYRRNQSIGWAIVWALLGGMFPVFVPAIALAQGFGKPKSFAPAHA